jgi:hypothetical protein
MYYTYSFYAFSCIFPDNIDRISNNKVQLNLVGMESFLLYAMCLVLFKISQMIQSWLLLPIHINYFHLRSRELLLDKSLLQFSCFKSSSGSSMRRRSFNLFIDYHTSFPINFSYQCNFILFKAQGNFIDNNFFLKLKVYMYNKSTNT